MIEHVYRRAAASQASAVMVATDDARISRAVTSFGGDVHLTNPAHRNGTERLAEVAANLTCELVVNVQGDEPLLAPESIDLALEAFGRKPGLVMATLRTPIVDAGVLTNPNVVKVVVDLDGFALYFSRAALPNRSPRDAVVSAGPTYKHIGLYVYRREFLIHLASLSPTPLEQIERLEQLRALEHGYRIKTVETSHDPIGVDTPEELDRVRRIVEDLPR